MSLCPMLQTSDCKDESNHGQKVIQSGLPPEASKLQSHFAKRHMDHRWRPESARPACQDYLLWLEAQNLPILILSGGVLPWLEHTRKPIASTGCTPSCAPCPRCKWCRAVARSLYPENQAVSIVLHVGHTLFLALIESWLSACRRVSRLCGRIGSARKEMSNQRVLSLSHRPSLYCFYPPFSWFPFCVITSVQTVLFNYL